MATISERIVTATQQLETNVASLTGAVSTASGSATLAGTYATASNNSALASAASAAQAAAIAAGLNYKGTVAGASVPATSTNSGDVYLISSAGTSQSKTWAQTDLAIYRGSSGNWDQITASVWLGLSLPLANNKVVSDCGISDGATSGRAVVQINNGAVTGSLPVVLAIDIPEVPTSLATTVYLFAASSNSSSPFQPYSLVVNMISSGWLQIQALGATTSDRRNFISTTFISSYGGQRNSRLSIEWTSGDTTTSPTVYFNGVDISSSFSASTNGTPINWWSPSLVPTYLIHGYNWIVGRVPVTTVILGTWTSTERNNWHTMGFLPSWALRLAGSSISKTSGGLTIGARYRIVTYNAGDDFTNVGAASNASGVEFTATGTTPTTWTNASVLIACGPVSRLVWQPCRVMDDLGSNNIPGIVVAGITPVAIRKDIRMQIQTSTNGNQQLGGNSLFLNSSSVRLDNWVIYNTGGTVTTSLGNVSAGTQYLSAGSITNGLNDVTLATRFNGTVNLWCNANSGIYLTHTIAAHLVV